MHAFARSPLWCRRDVTVSMTPEHVKLVTFLRLREFVWVGACVTVPVGRGAPPGRCGRSVKRSVEMASRRRFGAFVYTVATLWTTVGMQECTQIG